MKALELNQMEQIEGGSISDVGWNSPCGDTPLVNAITGFWQVALATLIIQCARDALDL